MPRVDFSTVPEAGEYTPVPAGFYKVEVEKVDEKQSKYGDELWSVQFSITEGEHEGRKIFDNLVFSEHAMKRVKLACARLGLDVSGELDLSSEMLIGKRCQVFAEVEEYEDSGATKERNKIPFAGYYAFDEETLVRIRSICDGHIELRINEMGERIMRTMRVAKMRGAQRNTGNIVNFDIEPEFGLRIVPMSSVSA